MSLGKTEIIDDCFPQDGFRKLGGVGRGRVRPNRDHACSALFLLSQKLHLLGEATHPLPEAKVPLRQHGGLLPYEKRHR